MEIQEGINTQYEPPLGPFGKFQEGDRVLYLKQPDTRWIITNIGNYCATIELDPAFENPWTKEKVVVIQNPADICFPPETLYEQPLSMSGLPSMPSMPSYGEGMPMPMPMSMPMSPFNITVVSGDNNSVPSGLSVPVPVPGSMPALVLKEQNPVASPKEGFENAKNVIINKV